MKKAYVVPVFEYMGYTNEIAFKAKCNFALRNDDCCDLQFK